MATLKAQLKQFAHVRKCCKAMTSGTQMLLWREDGFHLQVVRLRSVPAWTVLGPDMIYVLWEDAADTQSGVCDGVCVSELVDVVPSALSAHLQAKTALSLSMSLVTNDGCFDFLALSQVDWDCWYVGLRFLSETSEPRLQPLNLRDNSLQQGALPTPTSTPTPPEQQQQQQQQYEHNVDRDSRARADDDAVAVNGLHGVVPLLQEVNQRIIDVQRQQSELARCHQEALVMVAQAQPVHTQQQRHDQEPDYNQGLNKSAAPSTSSDQDLCLRVAELEQLSELKESTITVLQQLLATAVCE